MSGPSVEEMVAAITRAHDGIERTVTPGALTTVMLEGLRAARDYILSAERTIARLNDCPWCGAIIERLAVDGGFELGCTELSCPSFGFGVWCYADKLRTEVADLKLQYKILSDIEAKKECEIAEMRRLMRHRADGHMCAGIKCVDPDCADCLAFYAAAGMGVKP